MKVLFWGTYDTGKPRNRIFLRGLRKNGVRVTECHYDLWQGIEDKSQVHGIRRQLFFALRWLLCYPRLVHRFLRLPPHDAVIVGYLGHLDVLVLWFFAKIKGTPIVWDAFLSLHDTMVSDRKMFHRWNPLAIFLYLLEWLGCRAADLVVLDTRAHQKFFDVQYRIKSGKTGAVFVGAESELFPVALKSPGSEGHDRVAQVKVLFYGQCIPLHGIDTILRAAVILKNQPVSWLLIGQGQEEERIRQYVAEENHTQFSWIPWVPYNHLVRHIHQADICLGIFGESGKAGRVIPNKVFQVISCGKPLVTRDSPAMRELCGEAAPGIVLVPPGEPEVLAQAILELSENLHKLPDRLYETIQKQITPKAIGGQLQQLVAKMISV